MKKIFIASLSLSILALASCNNQNKVDKAKDSVQIAVDSNENKIKIDTAASTNDYAKETTNEAAAGKIADFFRKKFASDLKIMQPADRHFSFYELDLNDDKKPEYLVGLQSAYFCGTGGCSFYLLNNDFSVNTYFSVTNPPIFKSSAVTDGWHDLILKGEQGANGVKFIHLKYNAKNGSYPGNPSVVKQTAAAPSADDYVMWNDTSNNAKSFEF